LDSLIISDIKADPNCIAAQITTPTGLMLTFRPVTVADSATLGRYFLGLSAELKALYGPHPFDQATADQLCAAVEDTQFIRMIAVLPEGEVIAYFILELSTPAHEIQRYAEAGITITPADTCRIAPSVTDAYQNQGVGSPLMRHLIQVARQLGRKNLVLMEGVFGHNQRARHYYRKLGFREVGTFVPVWSSGRPCHDMFQEL
jgi:GNAT superfamily N-acetyltransferase